MTDTQQGTGQPAGSAQPKPKKYIPIIIIVILSLLLVLSAIKIYLDGQEKERLHAFGEQIEAEKNDYANRLDAISAELEEKIKEIEQLGGEVDDLLEAKASLEIEKEQIRRSKNIQLKTLRDRVEGYEFLLKEKDKEIDKLRQVNEELLTEVTDLKSEKNVLSDSINQLAVKQETLTEKVALASRLKAINILTTAISSRGKERKDEFKSRQVDQLRITFNIDKNDVAPIEGKTILVRIIDPVNKTLFDVATGSGTFMIDGNEEFYTAAQDILFDNTGQLLTYLYKKGSSYAEGRYTVEVYTDGYLMGKANFVVK